VICHQPDAILSIPCGSVFGQEFSSNCWGLDAI
jgi:hypothetical protein